VQQIKEYWYTNLATSIMYLFIKNLEMHFYHSTIHTSTKYLVEKKRNAINVQSKTAPKTKSS